MVFVFRKGDSEGSCVNDPSQDCFLFLHLTFCGAFFYEIMSFLGMILDGSRGLAKVQIARGIALLT
jgi:hypothetical protein